MTGNQPNTEASRTTDPKTIAVDIARELREHPERWFQGAIARHADGTVSSTELDSDLDVCWCLEGHILKRTGFDYFGIVRDAFIEVLNGTSVFVWNDETGRSVQEVISLCEQVANG